MSRKVINQCFIKDLDELYRRIDTSTNGQAYVLGLNWMSVMVALQPQSGFNAHALFNMTVSSFEPRLVAHYQSSS